MKTKIDILGTSFILHSDQDSEYVYSLLSYIEEQLEIIKNDVSCNDPLKASIMTSLLITHELFSLRETFKQDRIETDQVAKKLSIALDRAIDA